MREMEVVGEALGEDDIGWQTARRLDALSMYAKRAPSLPHPGSAGNPHPESNPAPGKGGGAPDGSQAGGRSAQAPGRAAGAAPAGGPAAGAGGPVGGAAAEGPSRCPPGAPERGAGASEIELAPSAGGRHAGAPPPV